MIEFYSFGNVAKKVTVQSQPVPISQTFNLYVSYNSGEALPENSKRLKTVITHIEDPGATFKVAIAREMTFAFARAGNHPGFLREVTEADLPLVIEGDAGLFFEPGTATARVCGYEIIAP